MCVTSLYSLKLNDPIRKPLLKKHWPHHLQNVAHVPLGDARRPKTTLVNQIAPWMQRCPMDYAISDPLTSFAYRISKTSFDWYGITFDWHGSVNDVIDPAANFKHKHGISISSQPLLSIMKIWMEPGLLSYQSKNDFPCVLTLDTLLMYNDVTVCI